MIDKKNISVGVNGEQSPSLQLGLLKIIRPFIHGIWWWYSIKLQM